MDKHPTNLQSTVDAKKALHLDDTTPSNNYAANQYWDACVQIDKLKMVLYTVFCSAQPTPEEFNIVLNHETGRAEIS